MQFEDLSPGDEISYQLTPDDRDIWHGRVLLLFPGWSGMRVEVLDRGKRTGNIDLIHVSMVREKTRYSAPPDIPHRSYAVEHVWVVRDQAHIVAWYPSKEQAETEAGKLNAGSDESRCVSCGAQPAGGSPPRCASCYAKLASPLPPFKTLSPRELEVLTELIRPRSMSEIAARLTISESAVWKYLSRIMAKLHLADRAQLVLFALQHGDEKPRADAGSLVEMENEGE